MGQRMDLHNLLLATTPNVYFQPPPSVKLEYPCIIYKRDFEKAEFADNGPYKRRLRYQVTVIDRNPDSPLPPQIATLPLCVYDRFYTADNLNHDVYNLFF